MIYVQLSWKNVQLSWKIMTFHDFWVDVQYYLSVYYTVSYSNAMLSTISLDNADGTTFLEGLHLRPDVDHRPINIFRWSFLKSALEFHGGDEGPGYSASAQALRRALRIRMPSIPPASYIVTF